MKLASSLEMKIELVILNYNGIEHLTHLLPTARAEALSFPNVNITVLDNRSTKNDANWVGSNFPDVNFVQAPGNDYLFSYNWYAEQSRADILIFLNNDLKLKPNFIKPLVSHFSFSDIFSVSATSRDWDDSEYTFGPIQLRHHHGDFYWNPDFTRQETSHTLFTSGGFMAVDRKKFLNIGGFNKLFYPIYCEDLEICFRAWKRGWRCVFEPASVALHREHASMGGKKGGGKADRLLLKTKLLFEWSSLPLPCTRLERIAYLTWKGIKKAAAGEIWWGETVLRTYFSRKKILKGYENLAMKIEEMELIINRIDQTI